MNVQMSDNITNTMCYLRDNLYNRDDFRQSLKANLNDNISIEDINYVNDRDKLNVIITIDNNPYEYFELFNIVFNSYVSAVKACGDFSFLNYYNLINVVTTGKTIVIYL